MFRLVLLLAGAACMVDSKIVDEFFEKDLLRQHNERRNELTQGKVPGQPAAANMKIMTWDKELQNKAQKWADNNVFQHNPDRTVPSGRFETGENLFWSWSSNPNWGFVLSNATDSWWSEHQHYSYEQNQGTNGFEVRHYTQMAWADSIYVGCGMHNGTQGQGVTYFIVCNYGPAGNIAGQRPYEKA